METKTAVKWGIALLIGVGVIVLGFRFAAWLLTSFFILNCLVLIIVVLLQSGKAAALARAFGASGEFATRTRETEKALTGICTVGLASTPTGCDGDANERIILWKIWCGREDSNLHALRR